MADQTAVLGLIDIASNSRGWGLLRYILGKIPFQGQPGLQFCKMLGSGYQGGFSTKPSFTKQGFFCVFDCLQNAAHFKESALVQKYQGHANEFFMATLKAYSSRGSWSGFSISCSSSHLPENKPIASLTRASIRPSKARQFWAKAKPAEDAIEQASGKILTAGLGEAPYFRQATFTIWENALSLEQYAQRGAHLAAIQAAYSQNYFSESMFTRFDVIQAQGVWQGKNVQLA